MDAQQKALANVAKMLVAISKYAVAKSREHSEDSKNYNYYHNIHNNAVFVYNAIADQVGTIDEQDINMLLQGLHYASHKAEQI